VPIVYMKGFCDSAGKVVAYRKDAPDRPIIGKPSNVGFEKHYYSQPLPEGGREDSAFEKLFGSIEAHWPEVLAAARRGQLDKSSAWYLFAFMTAMRARVPAARDFQESLMAVRLRAEVKALASVGCLPSELERYRDELDTVQVAINRHRTIGTMSQDMREFGDLLPRMGFELLRNETEALFITSDNPVAYLDPSKPSGIARPYVTGRNIELVFPLDARTMLCGSDRLPLSAGKEIPTRTVGAGEVSAINGITALFGYRFLFAADQANDKLAHDCAAVSPVLDAAVQQEGREVKIFVGHKFGTRPTLHRSVQDLARGW